MYFRNTCHLRIGTLSPWLTNTWVYLAIFPNTCTSSSLLFSLLMLRLYTLSLSVSKASSRLVPKQVKSNCQAFRKSLVNYSILLRWIYSAYFAICGIVWNKFQNVLETLRRWRKWKDAFFLQNCKNSTNVCWKKFPSSTRFRRLKSFL